MEPEFRGLGRCACSFWLAVAFDIAGLVVLLVGVFANVFFYDLLIYAGSIIIFLSLIWWVFWYSGNIEVPPNELQDDVGLLKRAKSGWGSGLGGTVRRLSSRLTHGFRNSFYRNGGARQPGVGQVAVAMATVSPQDSSPRAAVPPEADCDVQMPRTTMETSAT